jgi:hypothetical protein
MMARALHFFFQFIFLGKVFYVRHGSNNDKGRHGGGPRRPHAVH